MVPSHRRARCCCWDPRDHLLRIRARSPRHKPLADTHPARYVHVPRPARRRGHTSRHVNAKRPSKRLKTASRTTSSKRAANLATYPRGTRKIQSDLLRCNGRKRSPGKTSQPFRYASRGRAGNLIVEPSENYRDFKLASTLEGCCRAVTRPATHAALPGASSPPAERIRVEHRNSTVLQHKDCR